MSNYNSDAHTEGTYDAHAHTSIQEQYAQYMHTQPSVHLFDEGCGPISRVIILCTTTITVHTGSTPGLAATEKLFGIDWDYYL